MAKEEKNVVEAEFNEVKEEEKTKKKKHHVHIPRPVKKVAKTVVKVGVITLAGLGFGTLVAGTIAIISAGKKGRDDENNNDETNESATNNEEV